MPERRLKELTMKKPWIVFAIRPPRENYRVFKHFCGEFETKKKALAKATEFVASDNPNAEINLAETGMFDIINLLTGERA